MKLHDLGPDEGARQPKRRVGRGDAARRGNYAGRGRKGQGSRSGGGKGPYFEGGQLPLVRRLPFRRGFSNIFRVEFTPINLSDLEAHFDAGALVTSESLAEARLIRRADEPYKILGRGELKKKLDVTAPRFSDSARAAIEEAGGSCATSEESHERPGMGRRRRR